MTPDLAFDRARALFSSSGSRASHGPSGTRSPLEPVARCRTSGAMIKHILVPLDGTERGDHALALARTLARGFGARVTLLHVLSSGFRSAEQVDVLDWEIARAEVAAHLVRRAGPFGEAGIACDTVVLPGRPGEQINHFAESQSVDLIVLAGTTEAGSGSSMLGSSVQNVVGEARTSILIVPTDRVPTGGGAEVVLRRILVPLDCSPRAEHVLPVVAKLARTLDADVVLGHVVPEPEMPRRLQPHEEDLELASRLIERNRAEATEYLAEVGSRLDVGSRRVDTRLRVSARHAEALREIAEEVSADLVIISAHGHTGDSNRRYGSVAASLLQETHRPVLILQDLAAVPATTEASTVPLRGGSH